MPLGAALVVLQRRLPRPAAGKPADGCALSLAEGTDGVVVDVGANGGTESMLALRRGRKVYAFECLPSAYMELHALFRLNYPNVTVIHACAGQKTHIGELHLAQDSSSLSAANVEQAPHGTWERKKAMREAVPYEPALYRLWMSYPRLCRWEATRAHRPRQGGHRAPSTRSCWA